MMNKKCSTGLPASFSAGLKGLGQRSSIRVQRCSVKVSAGLTEEIQYRTEESGVCFEEEEVEV
jgi:hypothetical protein